MNNLDANFKGKVKLKQAITFPHLVLYGLGSMIGAGIYVLIGVIAGHAQFYTPFSFLIAGGVGLLTALSYADLSSHFPYSAGAALYVHHAFKNNNLSKLIGYFVILTGIVSCSALVKGFAGYARELVDISHEIIIFIVIMSLGLITCWRIHMSMWLISIITLIEIFGLIFIMTIIFSDFDISKLSEKMFVTPSSNEFLGLLNGSLLAFYAFIGFEDMVNVAEEVKDNKKVMKKGIIYAFACTIILYFLVSLITMGAVNIDLLTKTEAPFAEVLSIHSKWGSKLISIISIVATTNGALIQIIMSSRVFYGMARKKLSLPIFAKINPITHTPINAILFSVLLVLAFAYLFPIEKLATLTSFIVLIIFCLINLALIRLIMKKTITNKRFKHTLIPFLAFITSFILLISQIFINLTTLF